MPADPPFDLDIVDRLLTTTKAVRRRLDLKRPVDRASRRRVHPARVLTRRTPPTPRSGTGSWSTTPSCAGGWGSSTAGPPSRSCHDARRQGGGRRRGGRPDLAVDPVPGRAHGRGPGARRALLRPRGGGGPLRPAHRARPETSAWSPACTRRSTRRCGASCWPCAAAGSGSVLTTAHQSDQPAMAEILGIPSTWDQTALLPVAHTPAATSCPRRGRPSRGRSSGTGTRAEARERRHRPRRSASRPAPPSPTSPGTSDGSVSRRRPGSRC